MRMVVSNAKTIRKSLFGNVLRVIGLNGRPVPLIGVFRVISRVIGGAWWRTCGWAAQ